jgi:SAM-dependent methyltransferase
VNQTPGAPLPEDATEDAVSSSLAGRLTQLLDALGIGAAHFCAQSPEDLLGLLASASTRVASVMLVGANGQPEDFAALGARTLWISGDRGPLAATMGPRLAALPPRQVRWLADYAQFMWSDTVADHLDTVATAMDAFLAEVEPRGPAEPAIRPVAITGAGEWAGVAYRAAGSGTPVILLPLGLSAKQWDPLLDRLQFRHCTIVLGGPHLNPVANLETRAASGYGAMALDLLRRIPPCPNETFLEVGCGSGALLRRIVESRGLAQAVGLDINPFLLREAAALATREGLTDRLELREGSAEAIPFPDDQFDVVFASTVMEEVDADRMLAELVRVAKPGGTVAVMVRAVDRGQWTNAPLPAAVRQQVEGSPGPAGVAAQGCADESLSPRFHAAGLTQIQGGPAWVSVSPTQPWWPPIDRQVRGGLTAEAVAAWDKTIAMARREGWPVWVARPFHYAMGTKR